jgi:hypothetical protein
MLTLLLLAGCPSKDDAPADTGNPIVPDEYAEVWDLEGSSCAGAHAVLYFTFDGTIDDDGALTGTEKWYWFWTTEGWEGDCVDTFDVEGEDSNVNWEDPPCPDCERELETTFELTDAGRGCDGLDYEDYFWNHNVDDDDYSVILELETLDGDEPYAGAGMTVNAGFEDDGSGGSFTFTDGYATGTYTPEGDEYDEGAATLSWVVPERICAVIDDF